MPRNVPPRPPHNDLAQYLRDQGVVTKLTARGWIAAEKERIEAEASSLPAFSSEGQALVAHWESWSTTVLAELEEMTAGYGEVMDALEAAGLSLQHTPTNEPKQVRWHYSWDKGEWSGPFPSEGAAITHAIRTMRQPAIPGFSIKDPFEYEDEHQSSVRFEDGRQWGIRGGVVEVDLYHSKGMTDAAIGRAVRALEEYAWFLAALDMAHNIIEYTFSAEDVARHMEHYEFLQQFSGDPLVDKALALLDRGWHPEPKTPYKRTPTRGYVYLLRAETGQYKIGRTKDLPTRSKAIQAQMPFDVTIVHYFAAPDSVEAEKQLHTRFAAQRLNGKWFNLTPEDVTWFTTLGEGGSV